MPLCKGQAWHLKINQLSLPAIAFAYNSYIFIEEFIEIPSRSSQTDRPAGL